MVYLSLLVLIPLSAVFIRSLGLRLGHFWEIVTAPRVVASLRLSFGASLIAALINALFGLGRLGAWCATPFPFKRLIDAMVDLPFALPTAVAGIALTASMRRTAGSALRCSRWESRWLTRRWASSWR
jgi:sulfate transport system permease protein